MSDSPTLNQVLDAFVPAGTGLTGTAPESWAQGRTLYGGMTAALAWAATVRTLPDLPPLRSAQIAFVGPASGSLQIVPTLIRRGRSAAFVRTSVTGEAGAAAECLFSCGAPRDSRVAHRSPNAPSVPRPADCGPLFPGGPGPSFARNFEMLLAAGNRPFSGGEPSFTCWTRYTRPQGVEPLTAVLALADALPPAAMVSFPEFGIISSMTWTIEVDALPADADAWFLQQATAEDTGDGYSRQAMTLWDDSGRRLFAARQTVTIFV
ncbi:thioesterase family protein [Sphingomonas sp. BN140010]|uniref:Thioesterase family protein n=1 Tax=Sphingomonas arvum TaxID=2992113 RepID=A0ABT3JI20_9SPHN|nr:thioesterase family protein [Sphingomonas sp. BN140010]MCW3798718.1 thioesterase family protein [Sphingomonas sp. BN140010]